MSIDKKKISRSSRDKTISRSRSRSRQQSEKIQRSQRGDTTFEVARRKEKKVRSSRKKEKSRRRKCRVNPYFEKWSWRDLTMADTQYLESDLESITHVHESFSSSSLSVKSPSSSPSLSSSPSPSSLSTSTPSSPFGSSMLPSPFQSLSVPMPSQAQASVTFIESPVNLTGSGRGDRRPSRTSAPSPPSVYSSPSPPNRGSPDIAARRLSPDSPAHPSSASLSPDSLSPAPLSPPDGESLQGQALIDRTSLNGAEAQIREWADRMDSFVVSTEKRFRELQSTLENIRAEMRDGNEELLMFLQEDLKDIKARLLQPTVSFHGSVVPSPTQHASFSATVAAQPQIQHNFVSLQPIVQDAFIARPFEPEKSVAPSIASWYTAPNSVNMADLEGTRRETSSVLSSPPPIGEDAHLWPAGHDIDEIRSEEREPVDWSFLAQPSSPIAQSGTGTSPEASHGVSSDDTLLQNRLEQMVTISRLSSGVESLPSSCRCSVSPPRFTQHVLPTVSRSLRTPTRSIDYVHHPMDSAKKRARKDARLARIQSSASAKSASTRSGGISEHDLRGVSVHSREIRTLLPSDGLRTGAKWPRQGANTVKGRMEEIACDMCHGRVHWACAGLEGHDSLKNEPWACPDCRTISSRYNNSEDEDEGHTNFEVERAQQDRCLRSDCVWRSGRRIVRRYQDEDTFYIEAILGRRATGRRIYSTNKRVFEYLVKWYDWDIWDATWEPARHIPDLEYYQSHFFQAAKKADVDISRKVVLLPGVLEWYDEDGDRLDKKLTEMGIEPRTWWQDK